MIKHIILFVLIAYNIDMYQDRFDSNKTVMIITNDDDVITLTIDNNKMNDKLIEDIAMKVEGKDYEKKSTRILPRK